jgi:trehalose-6-phosphate synthase
LAQALPINPLDPEGFAATLRRALEMPPAERRHRLEQMQKHLVQNDIYHWVDDIFTRLSDLTITPWTTVLASAR